MGISERKAYLIEQIKAIDDDSTLSLVQEAIAFYAVDPHRDVTDGLSEEEIEELQKMMNDPIDKDVMTEAEFHNKFSKWRTK